MLLNDGECASVHSRSSWPLLTLVSIVRCLYPATQLAKSSRQDVFSTRDLPPMTDRAHVMARRDLRTGCGEKGLRK